LEKVCIEGAYYQIRNVKETMENRIQVDIIKPCYKEKILKILLKYWVDIRNIDNIDACMLVNEWIPNNMKEFRECVMMEIKKEMTIVCEREVNEELYEKIFGHKPEIETKIDSLPLQIFQKIEVDEYFSSEILK
jgi:hypothetical protein